MFFGHSQGGLNGPLFLAASDLARGGVLSGAGSMLAVALLEKTKPVDIATAVRVLLGLADERGRKELNVFHPAMTLAQSLVDAVGSDPLRRVHHDVAAHGLRAEEHLPDGRDRERRHGRHLRSAARHRGARGRDRPPAHRAGRAGRSRGAWAGIADVTLRPRVSGNLAGGRATGGLAQFAAAGGQRRTLRRLPRAGGARAHVEVLEGSLERSLRPPRPLTSGRSRSASPCRCRRCRAATCRRSC